MLKHLRQFQWPGGGQEWKIRRRHHHHLFHAVTDEQVRRVVSILRVLFKLLPDVLIENLEVDVRAERVHLRRNRTGGLLVGVNQKAAEWFDLVADAEPHY